MASFRLLTWSCRTAGDWSAALTSDPTEVESEVRVVRSSPAAAGVALLCSLIGCALASPAASLADGLNRSILILVPYSNPSLLSAFTESDSNQVSSIFRLFTRFLPFHPGAGLRMLPVGGLMHGMRDHFGDSKAAIGLDRARQGLYPEAHDLVALLIFAIVFRARNRREGLLRLLQPAAQKHGFEVLGALLDLGVVAGKRRLHLLDQAGFPGLQNVGLRAGQTQAYGSHL